MNFRDHPVPIGVGDKKVDEAGPGDLHLQEHALRGRQVVDDDFGHLPGRHLGLLGQDQGQVGGQVAVLGVFGRLHFEGGQGVESEFARVPGPFGTGSDQVTDGFFDVHYMSTFCRILQWF